MPWPQTPCFDNSRESNPSNQSTTAEALYMTTPPQDRLPKCQIPAWYELPPPSFTFGATLQTIIYGQNIYTKWKMGKLWGESCMAVWLDLSRLKNKHRRRAQNVSYILFTKMMFCVNNKRSLGEKETESIYCKGRACPLHLWLTNLRPNQSLNKQSINGRFFWQN